MQAVILVGGEGTRLRPLTLATPKPMVPLFGVPFLERTLSRLRHAGVKEVVMAAGYLPRGITDHLGDGSRLGMTLNYRVESSPLGTAGALRNVADLITGPFFVLNGDVLTSLDFGEMLAFHRERGGLGLLHSIRVDDPSPFGCIVADDTGRVSRFIEKPPRESAPTNLINAGTYLLEREILDAIAPDTKVSIERETFPMLLAAGASLYTFATEDYWLDIGRPEQYLQAHRDVLDAKLALRPSADPDAHRGEMWPIGAARVPAGVRSPSFIGDEVTIEEGAVVGPHAVIGDRCRIGAGARIVDSVLWNDVLVGGRASLEGAIVATGARIGANAVVAAGAVIGHGAEIEAGAAIAGDARIAAPAAAQS